MLHSFSQRETAVCLTWKVPQHPTESLGEPFRRNGRDFNPDNGKSVFVLFIFVCTEAPILLIAKQKLKTLRNSSAW